MASRAAGFSVAGQLIELLMKAPEKVLDKLLDPSFIAALGPQSGLQVTPATFQSVEAEGRWKPASLVNLTGDNKSDGRVFELAKHAETGEPPDKPRLAEHYGPVTHHTCPLFSLDMPALQPLLKLAALGAGIPLAGDIIGLLGTADRARLTVDAHWWSDGLEIFAGYAGLASATGFSSVWDTTASVGVQAVPWGNYYPARTLVTWSGWVNPVGPRYWEFRGGLVVDAQGGNSAEGSEGLSPRPNEIFDQSPPAYMQVWGREEKGTGTSAAYWQPGRGFLLSQDSYA